MWDRKWKKNYKLMVDETSLEVKREDCLCWKLIKVVGVIVWGCSLTFVNESGFKQDSAIEDSGCSLWRTTEEDRMEERENASWRITDSHLCHRAAVQHSPARTTEETCQLSFLSQPCWLLVSFQNVRSTSSKWQKQETRLSISSSSLGLRNSSSTSIFFSSSMQLF